MYSAILRKELVPAFGCTEPAAIAYAASLVKHQLNGTAERLTIRVSGNIVKNVQGVIVPNTQGRRGIRVSAIAGLLATPGGSELEILSGLAEDTVNEIDHLLKELPIEITVEDIVGLYVDIVGFCGDDEARAVIEEKHTNVVLVSKNGRKIIEARRFQNEEDGLGYGEMSFSGIYQYIETVDLDDIRDILQRQVGLNRGIARIGLDNDFGLNVGRTILQQSDSAINKIRAYTAAGSDARMGGSGAPVVINSGSGNQGITVSVPVSIYAEENGCDEDDVLRALALSNLVSIYIKSHIGSLSAFCGAVSAATGAGAAAAYLKTKDRRIVADTINNSLSNLSGVICDGAKASCAFKIASCVESSFLAMELAASGLTIPDGSGVIFTDVDETIRAIGAVGKIGMRETDKVILDIMTA